MARRFGLDKPNKAMLSHWREQRIFDFCTERGRQIISELESSAGEHGEDVQVLWGLVETWEDLSRQERMAADLAEARIPTQEGEG